MALRYLRGSPEPKAREAGAIATATERSGEAILPSADPPGRIRTHPVNQRIPPLKSPSLLFFLLLRTCVTGWEQHLMNGIHILKIL